MLRSMPSGAKDPPRCLIVDDHPSFRASARSLLESEGYEVVGEAENGAAAVQAARELHPDLVLLDVQLPQTQVGIGEVDDPHAMGGSSFSRRRRRRIAGTETSNRFASAGMVVDDQHAAGY